jgi:uncharacterized Zn-binding protein involved in type VI secretion
MIALDNHLMQPPGPSSPVMVPNPFSGMLNGNLSTNVNINGMAAAVIGSTATNVPPHLPIGGTFINPPLNRGTVTTGSGTVLINGKGAARAGDTATTCNDPVNMPVGTIQAVSTVFIGG